MSNVTTLNHDVVNTLYTEFGAQLLRVKANKTPAESRGWMDRQLSLDGLQEHFDRGGLLGLVPASVGLVAVDIDEGDSTSLLHNFPPFAAYRTKRPGGVHAYYSYSGPPIPQRRWVAPVFHTSGDLRHARGYVVLWDAERLTEDLNRGSGGVSFKEARQALVTDAPAPQGGPKSPPVASQPTPDDSPPSPARSRHVWVKARLIAARVDGLQAPALREYALQLHAGLVQPPDPRVPHRLPLAEVLALADWAAAMRWDPQTQAERGRRSGQARRVRTAQRDAEIIALLETGLSIRETALVLGISKSTVGRVNRQRGPRQSRFVGHP